jgi:stress-induced morphogen
MNQIESCIVSKLTAEFTPVELQVINESYMHSVPLNSETHFKVILVASGFRGMRQVQRHQAIYACLAQELQQGVHALALHTYAPDEWHPESVIGASPKCLGGNKTHE